MTATERRRFWRKVDKTGFESGDCWEWTGARTGGFKGRAYGAAKHRGRTVYAHRLAVADAMGGDGLPGGLHVDHVCHNRLCVRPSHLLLCDPAENLSRALG